MESFGEAGHTSYHNYLPPNPGNKSDLESQRAVSQEEAGRYAAENGLYFIETSAKVKSARLWVLDSSHPHGPQQAGATQVAVLT